MIPSCSLIATFAPSGGGEALAVELDHSSVSKTGSSGTITTSGSTVTATPSGGTSPYSYSWARVGGDSSTTAAHPSSAATLFVRAGCVSGQTYVSTWVCTVTDDNADEVDSSALQVTITRT